MIIWKEIERIYIEMPRFLMILLFDIIFIASLFMYGNEMGGYIVLVLLFIAFFTYELYRYIRNFFE